MSWKVEKVNGEYRVTDNLGAATKPTDKLTARIAKRYLNEMEVDGSGPEFYDFDIEVVEEMKEEEIEKMGVEL